MGVAQLNFTVSFTDLNCCKCGIGFAITTDAYHRLRKSHAFFYCPLCGQNQHFTGLSDEEKLRKELEAEKARKLDILAEANRLRECNGALNRSLTAQRSATKRIKNRVSHGVCPCCTRSFENLRRHMDTKHPDYMAEKVIA
jgi:hypothetical protein